MRVQEIKEAVQRLSVEGRAGGEARASSFFLLPSDFSEIAACLHSWNDDAWDEKVKSDLASSKLDKILGQVDADIAQNKFRGMP